MNPIVGHVPFHADYRVTWFPTERVPNEPPTKLGYVQQDFAVGFPLWQDDANELSATAHVRNESFTTHAILPDTGQAFPSELWNVRLGATYRHLFENGWIAGGGVSVGSASDRPFASINEMTAGVNAFLRIPQGDHNAWLFTLAYSPTAELAFPVPGVAYVWQPSDQFRMNVGLPFQVWYRPIDNLTIDLSYMLLRTVHARAAYRIWGPVRVYGAFDWGNESYFLADRSDNRDRFFYYDKRLTGGIEARLGRYVSLDLSAGYVFDRFYFEGHSYSDLEQNRVNVGNGPFGALGIKVKY
jgi:hypothetical protein